MTEDGIEETGFLRSGELVMGGVGVVDTTDLGVHHLIELVSAVANPVPTAEEQKTCGLASGGESGC